LTFRFRLMQEYDESYQTDRAEVFSETMRSGLVPLWEAIGVYDCLYNSDGKQARDISRALAYGLDRLNSDATLERLLPAGQNLELDDAIAILEKLLKACTRHAAARIETS
jgi:hypothetical protein